VRTAIAVWEPSIEIQKRKLIKTITRKAFDLTDPIPIWKVFDAVATDDQFDSVRACAACGMSALTANHLSDMLKGSHYERWNEDD
jgi:hypothetical protein